MKPKFFPTQQDFRDWLEAHYQSEKELYVGFYKVHTKKASLTWSESVDQALCFGWIDGRRNKIDDESYCIRFTPRRKTSVWSRINVEKVERLKKLGLMKAEGLAAYEFIKNDLSRAYSYENIELALDPKYEKLFKEEESAWAFYEKQASSYKRFIAKWIMSAKQEKTQLSRLSKAIQASKEQQKINW